MPQVFGSDELGLVSESSFLWVEAGFLEDVEAHEQALKGAGFEEGNLPHYIDRSGFHPRGVAYGQHLRSDGTHHTWAVARVANPDVDPNARETTVGGQTPRYSVEIHAVPKNPNGRARGSITPIWQGNDIRQFLNGQRRSPEDMTWPQVQKAMATGPRR
jgi:hypothetical protein